MEAPKYVVPSLDGKNFNCPFCGSFARFYWSDLYHALTGSFSMIGWKVARGECCGQLSVWETLDSTKSGVLSILGRMVHPAVRTAPMPARDMPEDVKADYLEAREVAQYSPRAAAALLRLAIQKLCVHLGGKGSNINEDIGNLVRAGLPVQVQQALDVVRVVGNNAVHPGELSPEDVASVADQLFVATNFIVQNQITQPNELKSMFGALPEGARAAVAKRDAPKG